MIQMPTEFLKLTVISSMLQNWRKFALSKILSWSITINVLNSARVGLKVFFLFVIWSSTSSSGRYIFSWSYDYKRNLFRWMKVWKKRFLFFPVGKYLFKVSKITLEQRSIERCSNVILLTLNRYLPTEGLMFIINCVIYCDFEWP